MLCLAFGAMLTVSTPAGSSVKGRRNTAEALTGAAVYHLIKGHGPETVIFAGGAVYAWDRVRAAKHHVGHYHSHTFSNYGKRSTHKRTVAKHTSHRKSVHHSRR